MTPKIVYIFFTAIPLLLCLVSLGQMLTILLDISVGEPIMIIWWLADLVLAVYLGNLFSKSKRESILLMGSWLLAAVLFAQSEINYSANKKNALRIGEGVSKNYNK